MNEVLDLIEASDQQPYNTKNSGSCLSSVFMHAKLPVTSKKATSSHYPNVQDSIDYCGLGNGCPRKPHKLSLPGFLTHALFQRANAVRGVKGPSCYASPSLHTCLLSEM